MKLNRDNQRRMLDDEKQALPPCIYLTENEYRALVEYTRVHYPGGRVGDLWRQVMWWWEQRKHWWVYRQMEVRRARRARRREEQA